MLPELKVGPLPSDQAHLYIQPLPPRVQDDSVQLSSDNQPLARIYEVPVTAISETAHPLWRHRLSLVLVSWRHKKDLPCLDTLFPYESGHQQRRYQLDDTLSFFLSEEKTATDLLLSRSFAFYR